MEMFLMWLELMVDVDYCLLKGCGGVLAGEESNEESFPRKGGNCDR